MGVSASRLVAFAAVLALAALAAGSASRASSLTHSARASGQAGPIVIGRVIGRTGFMTAYDGPPAAGEDLLIKELNARGGVLGRKIKVVEVDTKSDLTLVGKSADEAIAKGAQILIVSCDYDYGGAAAIEAGKKGILAISECAGSLKFGPLGIGPLAFTMGAPAPTYGAANAEWAFSKMKWRNAYVLTDTTILFSKEECAGFQQRWKQLGGNIVGSDTFQQKDVSVQPQITRMQAAGNIDFIYLCTYQPGDTKVLKQIRTAGIDTPLVGNGDWDGTYWKPGLPNANNIFFSTYGSIFGDDPVAAVNTFFKKYRAAYHSAPATSYPLLGYAMIQELAAAIQKTHSTNGTALAHQLLKDKNLPTVIGKLPFSPKFHAVLHRDMRIMKVVNGKTSFVTLWNPKIVPDTSKVK